MRETIRKGKENQTKANRRNAIPPPSLHLLWDPERLQRAAPAHSAGQHRAAQSILTATSFVISFSLCFFFFSSPFLRVIQSFPEGSFIIIIIIFFSLLSDYITKGKKPRVGIPRMVSSGTSSKGKVQICIQTQRPAAAQLRPCRTGGPLFTFCFGSFSPVSARQGWAWPLHENRTKSSAPRSQRSHRERLLLRQAAALFAVVVLNLGQLRMRRKPALNSESQTCANKGECHAQAVSHFTSTLGEMATCFDKGALHPHDILSRGSRRLRGFSLCIS